MVMAEMKSVATVEEDKSTMLTGICGMQTNPDKWTLDIVPARAIQTFC
jgi:hypothetical protein